MSRDGKTGREIYFEFLATGAFVRVTAIDPENGLEATIVGARSASQNELERLALAKLEFVRAKSEATPRPANKGVIV